MNASWHLNFHTRGYRTSSTHSPCHKNVFALPKYIQARTHAHTRTHTQTPHPRSNSSARLVTGSKTCSAPCSSGSPFRKSWKLRTRGTSVHSRRNRTHTALTLVTIHLRIRSTMRVHVCVCVCNVCWGKGSGGGEVHVYACRSVVYLRSLSE